MEETIPKLELTPISASRVKTYENCSWLYYCKYILRLPEPQNSGAQKGSVCHDIFEILLSPKHRKKYDAIVKAQSLTGCPSVARLTRIRMAKNGLPKNNLEIFGMIDKMILVGLLTDFFGKGGTLVKPEYEFNITNSEPLYCIKGFMDKPFTKGKRIVIDDFKSSKKKFEGEDAESNLQALIYSLAASKIWPELAPEVRFIFLQFPEDPIIKLKFSKEQLQGLEYYLADIQTCLDNFTVKEAYSSLAAHQDIPKTGEFKGKLLCGFSKYPGHKKKDGSVMFACPMKWAFKYYIVKDGKKVVKTYMDKAAITLKEGQTIEEGQYEGCPAYRDSVKDIPSPTPTSFKDPLDDF